MNPTLLALKKYLPTILYSVLGLIVLFAIYKLIMRLKAGGLAVGGVIADKAENQTIANQTGVSANKIKLIRQDAYSLAHDLNKLKGMTYLEKLQNFHIQFDSDTLKRFKNVTTAEEMSVFKNLYENQYTDNNSLLEDLQDTLSASSMPKVPFISTLY
jgi:hypothetical protein